MSRKQKGGGSKVRLKTSAPRIRSTPRFFPPNQVDQPGVGIAKDPLQSAARTKSWEGEQGGEHLDMLHRSSRSNAARSLPHISDKIRVSDNQAKPQAGCGLGEEDALSFTHSNLHRADY